MNRFYRLSGIVAICLLSLVIVSCNTNKKPRFQSDNETDMPSQFRRYTNRPAVDYTFRFNKQAFTQVENDEFDIMSDDKRDVITRHGRPDYFRENIKARRNEIFDEWVYWHENIICQFVAGELVFEGELLDSDRALIDWGYPSYANHQKYEYGPVREIWIWESELVVGERMMSFSDGKLVTETVN